MGNPNPKNIPLYLVGRNVSACVVTEVGVGPDGSVFGGPGANLSTLGVFDGFEYTGTRISEEISSVDSEAENNVALKQAFDIQVREICQSNGYSSLMFQFQEALWAAVQYQTYDGITGGSMLFQAIGLITSVHYASVTGKHGVEMTLVTAGLLPTYQQNTGPNFGGLAQQQDARGYVAKGSGFATGKVAGLKSS